MAVVYNFYSSTFAKKFLAAMFQISYLRKYPWSLQLLLFVTTIFIIASLFVGAIVPLLLPKLTGYTLLQAANVDETSSYAHIKAAILAQAFTHASIFLIPCLLFAYLTHPRPAYYLGLKKPGKSIHWLLVFLITISAMPVLMGMLSLFQSIQMGAWADELQHQLEKTEKAFFIMPSFSAFIGIFFVMAILPAIGEELLFRGILMRFIKKRNKGMVIPIIASGLMFALVHFTAYGFVPILFSGILLGLIYYLTGSILCSMLFHILNNGLQVIVVYMGNSNPTLKKAMESNSIPPYIIVGAIILLAISLYLLWKNRTPLPEDWANDFTKEELLMEESQTNA